MTRPRVAVIGGGWAGLSAASLLVDAGCAVTVFEASHHWGGRARSLPTPTRLPNGTLVTLDNGQHILSGAYTATLALLRRWGLDPAGLLHAAPLDLRNAAGVGLRLPDWPPPWNVLAGVMGHRGWSWPDRLALLFAAGAWQRHGFACDTTLSVADLTRHLPAAVHADLIAPLCVSALNTPPDQASAAVFLRVLRDALLGGRASARLLLPRVHLGALGPQVAARWLAQQGVKLHLGQRWQGLQRLDGAWRVHLAGADATANAPPFAAVVCATDARNSALALMNAAQTAPSSIAIDLQSWARHAAALPHTAIATVYAWAPDFCLPRPMLALPSGPDAPAQFVFDRGQLGGPRGLSAWVVSAATDDRRTLEAAVLNQARQQLNLPLQPVRTLIDKRATFACLPGLVRPPSHIGHGLVACGDFVAGPYPATIEGAVRSAHAAVAALQADGVCAAVPADMMGA